ncbi:MAG: long-chain fatty acid--CoA ligase [Ruminococcaceae bacterium]|nr:long-chain fatty acid--CoA ligase [Oscillospiraceae bacterium]
MAQPALYQTKKLHDLREMLEESAVLYGNRPAFLQKIDGKYRAYSYARYKNEVMALGTALSAQGFGGKRIIVIGENCYAWCLSYMTAVCGLGAVVPVDKEIPAEEIANIARLSEAALILHSQKYGEKLAQVDAAIVRISFDDLPALISEGMTRLSDGDRSYLDASIDIDTLCSLIFTSGTTGVSKGVMLSQRNLCHTIRNLAKMVRITPEDRALSVLPLHHVYECTCGFLYPLFCGASVAFSEGVRYIMKNVKETRPTKILCVPLLLETMYRKIWANIRKKGIEDKVRTIIKLTDKIHPASARMAAKRKLFAEIHESFGGRLDLLISGGAPIDPEIIKGMRAFGLKVIQGYGLTESSPLAAVNRDCYFNDRSAGLCLPEGELRIVDPAEDGTGEICYRGDNVMIGYYGRPDLTAEVKKNGWLYTGDIGYINEHGFLIITGRKKNVIIRANGKNVFPEELESYLCRSPWIDEAVVLSMNNEKRGEVDIVAVIRPDTEYAAEQLGRSYDPAVLEQKITAAVAEVNCTVQTYKRIDLSIVTTEEFPKNSSKKIKRFALPAMIEEEYHRRTK